MKATLLSLVFLFGYASFASGFLLKHVKSKKCMTDMDKKTEQTRYSMGPCTTKATQFKLLVGRDSNQRLASGWGNKEKCAFANTDNSQEQGTDNVWSSGCDGRQYCPYLQWEFKDLGNNRFLVIHPKEGWCMVPGPGAVQVSKGCDEKNENMIWTKQ